MPIYDGKTFWEDVVLRVYGETQRDTDFEFWCVYIRMYTDRSKKRLEFEFVQELEDAKPWTSWFRESEQQCVYNTQLGELST